MADGTAASGPDCLARGRGCSRGPATRQTTRRVARQRQSQGHLCQAAGCARAHHRDGHADRDRRLL